MAALAGSSLQRLVAIGFIAGALSILTFHQGTIALLQLIGGRPLTVYSMRGVAPFGVPQILNSCFWGGLWGIVFLWATGRLAGRYPGWLVGLAVGAVATTAVAWVRRRADQGPAGRRRLEPGDDVARAGDQRDVRARRHADRAVARATTLSPLRL